MIRSPHPGRRGGFTLVELLTVVTIIVILAGLTVGGLSFYNRRVAEDKTRMQIKLLANALETYRFETGAYPQANNPEGINQTRILWERLFGDGEKNDTTVYLSELDPASTRQGWLEKSGNVYRILDGFGTEFRYRRLSDAAEMRNPDFDLWSCGADGRSNAASPYNPNHPDNRDDIWD